MKSKTRFILALQGFCWVLSCALLTLFLPMPFAQADDFVVTSTSDIGVGSLNTALVDAYFSDGPDTITFDIGIATIAASGNFQALSAADPITLDGGGKVTLDGSGAGSGISGLELETEGHTVRGMIVANFGEYGIYVTGNKCTIEACAVVGSGQDGIRIEGNTASVTGCWIGTNGTSALGNTRSGIYINGATDVTIGGPAVADRNIISANGINGIAVYQCNSGIEISGNYIGTTAMGSSALGNVFDGIWINNTAGVRVGGAGKGNVVSGNDSNGITIVGTVSTDCVVQGNYIGVNAAGTAALPNTFSGLIVQEAGSTQVGGTEAGEGNVISGNGVNGIQVTNYNSNFTTIEGNFIGVDFTGTLPVPNTYDGIYSSNTNAIRIGQSGSNSGNIISANGGNGIYLSSTGNCRVFQNKIGVNINGDPMGNVEDGVRIASGTTGTRVGIDALTINTIAHNGGDGVEVLGTGSEGNTISRNSIYSNTEKGILLNSGGNGYLPAPTLTSVSPVSGTATANARIELFADSEDEGREFIWPAFDADASGNFSSDIDLSAYIGLNLTATATDVDGNTSEFSAPLLIDSVPVEGEVCAVGPFHSADQDESGTLSLNELLRLIQFFNSGGFGCEFGTEDGYIPNGPSHSCCTHSSDYNPNGPSWTIDLTELLRLIQFFNSGGYHVCSGDGTEDGFCPGL